MPNLYATQPDLMAIGDSLYQGVRSLTISADLARFSPPAQVAAAGGWAMTLPDPPAEVVFDLEAMTRRGALLSTLGRLQGEARASIARWHGIGAPWSAHEAFDNIAFGGAGIRSLWQETYARRIEQVRVNALALNGPDLPFRQVIQAVGALWYALSICFTLNPRQRQEQADCSALQQAADRAPSILLVNIGSNEGLFRAGLTGDASEASFARLRAIPGLVAELADHLAALPARTERIVYNSVLRPRFVPNLMPRPEDRSHPGEDYFTAYGNRIGSTQQGIDGATMRALDEAVRDANDQSRQILEQVVGPRLVWNDLYRLADPFDGKHWADRGVFVRDPAGRHRRLANTPVEPDPFGDQGGGFAGLDNMHPTVPGYAVIADTVLAALGRAERIDKDTAFAQDTLLTRLPAALVLQQAELALAPLGGIMGDDAPTPATPPTV